MPQNVWFITGASRGLGRALADALLSGGERVVATARRVADLDDLPDDVLRLPLDVTDPAQVRAAAEEAIRREGHVDVLVNNAGHGLLGALEELTEQQFASVLATNVHGVFTVTRALLPHFRARRRGHIVQLSSVGGVVGNPGHAAYATSKFALEGMSEALAGEVAPFGIGVTIVEPGPFRTGFAGPSMRFATPIDDYRDTPAGALRVRFSDQDGAQPNDPVLAARAIIDAVRDPASPLRLPLGPEAVDRIRDKLRRQLADLETTESVSRATRYGRECLAGF